MPASHTVRRLSLALAVATSGGVLGTLGLAGTAVAAPAVSARSMDHSTTYQFTTLDNTGDVTFNQLLGINREGVIAGYFGSGAAGHPNQGYLLAPPYGQGNYQMENFTGSVQTQVTGLNDRGTEVGFWAPTNTGTDANYGWFSTDNGATFTVINPPNASPASPPVTQLLGVNDSWCAVGFYNDSAGNSHGFVYDIRRNAYEMTDLSGATSVTDAAINNRGDIAGFATLNGTTEGFVQHRGHTLVFSFPGATSTQATGINDRDEVVGVYTDSAKMMHGFTWTPRGGFTTVDDPNGIGTTTVNGVNDAGDLVGFYTDAAGNVDGMLATPQGSQYQH